MCTEQFIESKPSVEQIVLFRWSFSILKKLQTYIEGSTFFKEGPDNAFTVNAMRLAEVWLDDYKQVFYAQANPSIQKYDIGDIRDRLVNSEV